MAQPPGNARPEKRNPPGNPRKLSRPEEYRAVLGAQYRLAGKHFMLRALPNQRSAARLGLISSRKAAPLAVDRNRGKRLAREAFRAAFAQLPAVDIVFEQKSDLRRAGNAVIRREIDRLLIDLATRFACGGRCNSEPSASPSTATA